ncbi:hypothetical protein OS493_037857 [Desmophyllum pertusum]|uniref:Uncharacterized protein n=1 Tax=Desmophyllum pertusum TaxID=174260 RepID=A0A9W9ZJ94_9CNID|nr:hypothetical protein OS493_037857 [Desmophyllum pertusum]
MFGSLVIIQIIQKTPETMGQFLMDSSEEELALRFGLLLNLEKSETHSTIGDHTEIQLDKVGTKQMCLVTVQEADRRL